MICVSCLLNYIVSSTSSISFDLSAQFINIRTSLQITNLPTNQTKAFPYLSIYLNCLLVWLGFPLPTRVCNSHLHYLALCSLGFDGTPYSCFCWMLSPAPVHTLPAPFQAPPLAPLSIFLLHIVIP